MAKSLAGISLQDLLPGSIAGDATYAAFAAALDPVLQQIIQETDLVRIWSRLDEIDEPVLRLLAAQMHVDIWDHDFGVAVKRDIVRKSVLWHMRKGTVWAVVDALQAVLEDDGAGVSEWFEYDGDPGRFKVICRQPLQSEAAYRRVLQVVQATKNVRSHLDAIQTPQEDQVDINVVGVATLGVSITGLMDTSVTVTDVDLSAVGVAAMPLLVHGLLPSPDVQVQDVNLTAVGVACMPIILSGYLPEEVTQ